MKAAQVLGVTECQHSCQRCHDGHDDAVESRMTGVLLSRDLGVVDEGCHSGPVSPDEGQWSRGSVRVRRGTDRPRVRTNLWAVCIGEEWRIHGGCSGTTNGP